MRVFAAIVLITIGVFWALIGVANIFEGFVVVTAEYDARVVSITNRIVSVLVFILPGLICALIGQKVWKRNRQKDTQASA